MPTLCAHSLGATDDFNFLVQAQQQNSPSRMKLLPQPLPKSLFLPGVFSNPKDVRALKIPGCLDTSFMPQALCTAVPRWMCCSRLPKCSCAGSICPQLSVFCHLMQNCSPRIRADPIPTAGALMLPSSSHNPCWDLTKGTNLENPSSWDEPCSGP